MLFVSQPVKQVFSTMEFLGWYTIGGSPTKEDVTFHQQVHMYMYVGSSQGWVHIQVVCTRLSFVLFVWVTGLPFYSYCLLY